MNENYIIASIAVIVLLFIFGFKRKKEDYGELTPKYCFEITYLEQKVKRHFVLTFNMKAWLYKKYNLNDRSHYLDTKNLKVLWFINFITVKPCKIKSAMY